MNRLKEVCFTPAERAELTAKVEKGLGAAGIDALLVSGSSNITYLSGGIVFPYLDQRMTQPVALFQSLRSGRRLLACTHELSDIPCQLGWDGEVVTYELSEPTPAQSLAAALARALPAAELAGLRVGCDFAATSSGQLAAFQAALPAHEAVGLDETVRDLRLVKTEAEIRLLEIVARMGDRGFISALNHTEGAALDSLSYPVWEYGERFRVHVGEFGGSGVGNLALLRGERGRDLYSPTPTRETFVPQEFVRMENSLHSYGYWSTGARTVYTDRPDQAALQSWSDNQQLKRAALATLRPGSRASDVYAAVVAASEASGIPFWQTSDVGHGVGTAEREAPYLAPYDQTALAPGMVIVLAVYTFGSQGELIGNKDTYLITEAEPRLLTWYKNWDRLYALHGTSARHG
jgi:Xaa-Pro aminopeptidase